MSSASFDDSGIRELQKAIAEKVRATPKQVEAVVHRGSNNIKRQQQEEMRASKHFSAVAGAISYDLRAGGGFGGGFVESEIGPVKGAPGSLANIAYFGGSRGGGTVPDPSVALEAEEPKFNRALEDLIGDF